MRTIIIAAMLLSGCAPKVIYRDRPVEVRVPVAQPCATERPDKVVPLKERLPDAEWGGMDVRQKTAATGRQVLDRQTYGEALDAATAACPEME